MKPNALKFIEGFLGKEFFQELKKGDIVFTKPYSLTVDGAEIQMGLDIVPKTIMKWLLTELKPMKPTEIKSISIPCDITATLNVHKLSSDSYNGDIVKDGRQIYKFLSRSVPGIGLIVMTTFELYDSDDLNKLVDPIVPSSEVHIPLISHVPQQPVKDVLDVINDFLKLKTIIQDVVDERIQQRKAIEEMAKYKITQALFESAQKEPEPVLKESENFMVKKEKPKLKLEQFLEDIKSKKQKTATIVKKEEIKCKDCGTVLYKGGDLNLCICYGEHMSKPLKVEKTEKELTIKLPVFLDEDNTEMLLESLNNKK
jgi:hypothetical protein